MKMQKLIPISVFSVTLATAFALTLAADPSQQDKTRPRQRQNAGKSVGHRTHWKNSDHMFAACVALGNQEEISIARFAQEKSKNDEVKEFAKMMVQDHQAFLQKLERFAPEATRNGYLSEKAIEPRDITQPDANERDPVRVDDSLEELKAEAGTIQQTSGTQEKVDTREASGKREETSGKREEKREERQERRDEARAQQWRHIDFMALHREMAESCLQQAKQELSKKDGDEFDECFIGQQIAKHAAMKSALTVFERHTTGDLHQVLADGLSTTEKHLSRAQELKKKLAASSAASKSRT